MKHSKWADPGLEHHHERSHGDVPYLDRSIRKRVGIEHLNESQQNIDIERQVHLIHHQVVINRLLQSTKTGEKGVIQDRHQHIEVEDIDGRPVRRAQAVVEATVQVVAIVVRKMFVALHHPKNQESNRRPIIWTKFVRCERQRHRHPS